MRVYVSSTWLDLQPERQAVEQALQQMRETKFIGMEHFGSVGEGTRQASLDELDRCDVYVGIFGERTAWNHRAEYNRAASGACRVSFTTRSSVLLPGHDPDLVLKTEHWPIT